MIQVSVSEVVRVLNSQVRGEVNSRSSFPSISIDSRTVQKGECFLALEGPRFDGHDFITEALNKGASVVIHSRNSVDYAGWKDQLFLQVEETLSALQKLAGYLREKWGKFLLAISGSMGKTTTREFTTSLLAQKFQVFQSPGNLNNLIGLPLSLLQLSDQHHLAVLELGMSRPGEIRSLANICSPDAGLLTNVAAVHSEFFADVDEIALAKEELVVSLPPRGRFFFNADDRRLVEMAARYPGSKTSFGWAEGADVRILDYSFDSHEQMSFRIEVGGEQLPGTVAFVGRHFLYDLAAAMAVASSLNLTAKEIRLGLPLLKVPPMRGQIRRLRLSGKDDFTVWDDSYNSNPGALSVVLEAVERCGGFDRKILALGDMLELGPSGPEVHRNSGQEVVRCGADLLVTVGQQAMFIGEGARDSGFPAANISHFETWREAASFLITQLQGGDLLLVKGSRGIQMDRLIQELGEEIRS